MKKRIALLCMLCGVLVLSGCGGSSRVDELERRVNVAEPLVEQLRRDLEVAKTQAETAKTAEEAAKTTAEAALIRANLAETAKTEAEKERDAAVTAKTTAEAARDAAVTARDAAVTARDTAVAERNAAVAARDAAVTAQEAETQRREQAEEERAKAERLANQADARLALAGNYGVGIGLTGVQPRYNEAANVTVPSLPQARASTSSAGRWFKTTIMSRDQTNADTIEIYSDVASPGSIPFKDSTLNDAGGGGTVVDSEGMLSWARNRLYDLGADTGVSSEHARSGSFPRVADGTIKSFSLVDRGQYETQTERQTAIDNAQTEVTNCKASTPVCGTLAELETTLRNERRSQVRNTERYPLRYNAEVGGTLQGASGTFTCAYTTNTASDVCTVQNRGSQFYFVGPWEFRPSSATAGVRIPDTDFMWFGQWSRQVLTGAGSFQFRANHGCGYSACVVTDVAAVSGTATYRGRAIGQYAIYQPLGEESGHGSFNADAVLIANFDSSPNTVSGTIENFSEQPGWEVILKPGEVTGGAVAGPASTGVSWTINGTTHDAGTWEADFYSNLPTDQRTGVVPYGVAGTFTADYGAVGAAVVAKMIGAFGAHSR